MKRELREKQCVWRRKKDKTVVNIKTVMCDGIEESQLQTTNFKLQTFHVQHTCLRNSYQRKQTGFSC